MTRSAPTLISQIPEPLLQELVQGRWLPLVGAGFSRNGLVPTGAAPLAWSDLGSAIAAMVPGLGVTVGALEALSAYEHQFGRVELVDKTSQLIRAHDAVPGRAHLAFAQLGFTNVITTNFDFLLERAFDTIGKGCLPVLDEVQLSAPNRYRGPRLIKMHGDIHHPDRLIITEDDYDRFLIEYPLIATSITAMLIDHCAVLIGYSLDDPDTRQLLSLIKNRLGRLRRPLWSIQVDAPAHIVSRYERRGVKVVNLLSGGLSRSDLYERLFLELAAYWEDALAMSVQSSDDRITADLRVPDEPSRICFFDVPDNLQGWYKDVLFPIVDAHGYIPAFSRDVVSPAGTQQTKIDTLIGRAALVVLDIGNNETGYATNVAVRKGDLSRIFFITAQPIPEDSRTSQYNMLMRPVELEADPIELVQAFENWLSNRGRFTSTDFEPEKLLAEKVYWAALVSAVSFLELSLSRYFGEESSRDQRTSSLRVMLRLADREGLMLSDDEYRAIEDAVIRRNESLHLDRPVSELTARQSVATIRTFVTRLVATHPERFD